MVQDTTLTVHPISGKDLRNVESLGRQQDPYLRFGLDLKEPKSFQETEAHEDAGLNPAWESKGYTFDLSGREEYLYVDVMDKEKGVDSLIGFAAIPLQQVRDSPTASINGNFDVYYTDEKKAGEINLKLVILGSGKPTSHVSNEQTRGRSIITEEHLHRAKGLSRKEKLGDAASVGGAALLAGAAYFGKKFYDGHHKEQEANQQ